MRPSGPILAGIFGGVIGDGQLAWRGIRHEIYSLLLCILIGFLLGLVVSPWARQYGQSPPPTHLYCCSPGCSQWPTSEMLGRGEWRALWVGVLIAIPSGAGVALSVLGGNAGSLVGVAISASLLPPAVNCGLFWALSVVLWVSGLSDNQPEAIFYTGREVVDEWTNVTTNMYQPRYVDDNLPLESFYLGLISLVLTLVNILCIILTGVFILRIKEVTSEKIPQKFAHFWRKDIRAHRDYNKAIRKDESISIPPLPSTKEEVPLEGTFLQALFDRVAQDEELINIRQWVAMPASAMVPDTHDQYRVGCAVAVLNLSYLCSNSTPSHPKDAQLPHQS